MDEFYNKHENNFMKITELDHTGNMGNPEMILLEARMAIFLRAARGRGNFFKASRKTFFYE